MDNTEQSALMDEVEAVEQEEPEEEQAKAEVSEEDDSEVPDGEEEAQPKFTEDDFQSRLKDEYAKWQSKTLSPATKERDTLRKQVGDLTEKLHSLEDEQGWKELSAFAEEEGKSLADNGKERYISMQKAHREFKERSALVNRAATAIGELKNGIPEDVAEEFNLNSDDPAELITGAGKLLESYSNYNLQKMAWSDATKMYLPEGDKLDKNVKGLIDRLTKANSPEHYQEILRAEQAKNAPKRHKPTKVGGGSGGGTLTLEKISKMSPEEKVRRNKEILKFFEETPQ